MLGMDIRMNRLFDSKHDRFFEVLVDHTIARGLQPDLLNIDETIGKIVKGKPLAITMHKGIAEKVFPKYAGQGVSLVLKGSTPSKYNPTCHAFVTDVDEALAFGADAIALGAIFCSKDQLVQMEAIGEVVRKAHSYGLPVIGHCYPNGEFIEKDHREDWENVAYASRVGAELGVDILKIHCNGAVEDFEKIVNAVPAKVVLAGGSAGNGIEDYLNMARRALDGGVSGCAFGRFVWSYKNVPELVAAIKHMVIEDTSVKEALEYLHDLEAEKKED